MPRCNGSTRKGIRCTRVVPVHNDSCLCHQHRNTDNSDCSICLEAIRLNRKKVYTTSCNHTFHASCMRMWLGNNDTCPYCCKVLTEAILINILEKEEKKGFRGFLRGIMCMK